MKFRELIEVLWLRGRWPGTWLLWGALVVAVGWLVWHGCSRGATAAWTQGEAAAWTRGSAANGGGDSWARALPDSAPAGVEMPVGARVMERRYRGFVAYYDTAVRMPRCVVYRLTRDHLDGDCKRQQEFEVDESVARCVDPAAYKRSGMQRGHMAPAADMAWDSTAMHDSFVMTNVCPQVQTLNEGGWARLEEKVREWARREGALWVYSGPVIDSAMTATPQGLAVPSRYYKVIVSEATATAVAFVLPNGPCRRSLRPYATTVGEVERMTGLRFFGALPDDVRERLTAARHFDYWIQARR